MKHYFLAACCLILLSGIDCLAQRCGDDIWLYLRDSNSRVIPPDAFDSVKASVYDNREEILDNRHLMEVPKGIQSFAIPTGCGVRLTAIVIRYQGKEMVLEVRNVAGDSGNILIDGVPFREGVFEVDLERLKMSNCEFDSTIEEPRNSRGGSELCVIRPAKWKGVTASGEKAELTVKLTAPATVRAGEDIAHLVRVEAKNSGTVTAPKPSDIADLYTNARRGYQIDLVLSTDENVPIQFADAYVKPYTEDMLIRGGRISYEIVDLAPGGSKQYRFKTATIWDQVPAGNYFLCAVIDPGKTVAESDETNNVSCSRIEIKAKLR